MDPLEDSSVSTLIRMKVKTDEACRSHLRDIKVAYKDRRQTLFLAGLHDKQEARIKVRVHYDSIC
jgi:hypothetical protein